MNSSQEKTKKVAILITDGTEIIETFYPYDVLKWGGIEVDFVGANDKSSASVLYGGTTIDIKKPLSTTNLKDYDCLVIPGNLNKENRNLHNLVDNELAITRIKEFFQQRDKLIASICLGALVIGKAGIIKGKTITGNPLVEKHDLFREANRGKLDIYQNVIVSDNIITGKTVVQTPEWTFKIIEKLLGEEKLKEIKKTIGFSI